MKSTKNKSRRALEDLNVNKNIYIISLELNIYNENIIGDSTPPCFTPFSPWNFEWLVRKLVAKLDESSVFDHPHNKKYSTTMY